MSADQSPDQSASRVASILSEKNLISICVPQNPTADSIAAATSLYLALLHMGKTVGLAAPATITQNFDLHAQDKFRSQLISDGDNLVVSFPYIEGSVDKVSYNIENDKFNLMIIPREGFDRLNPDQVTYGYTGGKPQVIVTIYAPTLASLGDLYTKNKDQFSGVELINIDRHFTNGNFGTVNFVDKKSGSMSEMVLDVIKLLKADIDKEIATNLYSGISAATNNFTAHSVNAQTFQTISFLMEKGAVKKEQVNAPAPMGAGPMGTGPMGGSQARPSSPYTASPYDDFDDFDNEPYDDFGSDFMPPMQMPPTRMPGVPGIPGGMSGNISGMPAGLGQNPLGQSFPSQPPFPSQQRSPFPAQPPFPSQQRQPFPGTGPSTYPPIDPFSPMSQPLNQPRPMSPQMSAPMYPQDQRQSSMSQGVLPQAGLSQQHIQNMGHMQNMGNTQMSQGNMNPNMTPPMNDAQFSQQQSTSMQPQYAPIDSLEVQDDENTETQAGPQVQNSTPHGQSHDDYTAHPSGAESAPTHIEHKEQQEDHDSDDQHSSAHDDHADTGANAHDDHSHTSDNHKGHDHQSDDHQSDDHQSDDHKTDDAQNAPEDWLKPKIFKSSTDTDLN